jgi:hypothetical protein
MHFDTKSYLKNTRNHTAKQGLHEKEKHWSYFQLSCIVNAN